MLNKKVGPHEFENKNKTRRTEDLNTFSVHTKLATAPSKTINIMMEIHNKSETHPQLYLLVGELLISQHGENGHNYQTVMVSFPLLSCCLTRFNLELNPFRTGGIEMVKHVSIIKNTF